MQALPTSIQRAILRRHAAAGLFSALAVVGLTGYLPWSSVIFTVGLVGVAFIMAGSRTAQRLRTLQKNKRATTTYVKSVENLINNLLVFSLPLLAVSLLGLNRLVDWPADNLNLLIYSSIIALALITSLCFYIAQLPAVSPDHKIKSFCQ